MRRTRIEALYSETWRTAQVRIMPGKTKLSSWVNCYSISHGLRDHHAMQYHHNALRMHGYARKTALACPQVAPAAETLRLQWK